MNTTTSSSLLLLLLLLSLELIPAHAESQRQAREKARLREGEVSRIPLFLDKSSNKLGLDLVVGNKTVRLVIDTLNEGIRLFQDGTEACNKGKLGYSFLAGEAGLEKNMEESDSVRYIGSKCYDPLLSEHASWCYNKDSCRLSFYLNTYTCNKSKEFPRTALNGDFNAFFHAVERVYDGICKLEIGLEGNELVRLPWTAPELFTLQEFPIRLIRSNLSTGNGENWPSFHNFDGFIGLVGSSISCRGISIWNDILMLYNTSTYAFEVNFDHPNSSFIYLNSPPEHWDSSLIYWSEPKQSGSVYDDALNTFQLYNPKVCESLIMENISSNWLAALDLSSTCLSLPPFMYARLVKWLPLECPEGLIDASRLEMDDGSREGHADSGELYPYSSLCVVKRRPLPAISFWLSQMDPSNDKVDPIRIFLDDYIIHYNNADYLCVLNSQQGTFGRMNYVPYNEEYYSNNFFPYYTSSSTPLVLLGSLFLRSYGLLVDNHSGRIGFYPKFKYKSHDHSPNTGHKFLNSSNCTPKKECPKEGGFSYDSSTNECVPPNCSDWLLYEFNADTNKCELNSAFPLVLTLVLGLFAFFEIHIMYLKQFVLDRSSEISSNS